MKIKELTLQNFKRFTDLTITGIPEDCRLVLLIGANGSGKSCVFDAMNIIEKDGFHAIFLQPYYKKISLTPIKIEIEFHGNDSGILLNEAVNSNEVYFKNRKFYGRPSLRIIPEARVNDYSTEKIKENKDTAVNFAGTEERFLNDLNEYLEDFIEALATPIFENRDVDTAQLREEFIQPLNMALKRVFSDEPETSIQLSNLSGRTSRKPPQLFFKKGGSTIPYDYLSHGEKQVIILLLNFMVRRKYYEDAIWFIDEMDVHLNTALQYNLLKEITENWLPPNCQLWTASHSLGFIDYARDDEQAAIIDFDNLDFDLPQTLTPAAKDYKVYDISIPKEMVDKLYYLGNQLVVCENQNDELLNKLEGESFKKFFFSGMANSSAVFAQVKADERITGLRDRDYLTTNEIKLLQQKYPNYRITGFYCFENYLFHPENIAALNLDGFNMADYTNDIIKQKKQVQNIIIPNLTNARRGYEEFRIQAIKPDKDLGEIIKALQSDVLDDFYSFFSMKDYYQKNYLGQFNINKEDLVKTNWFKTQFEKILL